MKWFFFEPKEPLLNFAVYVQIDSVKNAIDFLEKERKIDTFDYKMPHAYNTLDYASYHYRGCEYSFMDGVLRVNEVQRKDSCIRYQSLEKYTQRKDVKIFDKSLTSKYVDAIVEKVERVPFDGCNCRECGKAYYMSEPDGLKADGKLTCYPCRDRLKSLKMFPYSK